jgi:broad specificity phosphatase PhoE
MVPVTLMRHAEADWTVVNRLQLRGAANDLAPLTELGREQARAAGHALTADLVLCSPMTRALQTAAIIAGIMNVGLSVEFDLREWLPDETYSWTTPAQVDEAYQDMRRYAGLRPDDHPIRWEPLHVVRHRALAALEPWVESDRHVVAVCHEVVIFSLTGHEHTGPCQTRLLLPAERQV